MVRRPEGRRALVFGTNAANGAARYLGTPALFIAGFQRVIAKMTPSTVTCAIGDITLPGKVFLAANTIRKPGRWQDDLADLSEGPHLPEDLATTSQTLETSSFRCHHEACQTVHGMTPERTMTSVVTKELALDGTSAIKELKAQDHAFPGICLGGPPHWQKGKKRHQSARGI